MITWETETVGSPKQVKLRPTIHKPWKDYAVLDSQVANQLKNLVLFLRRAQFSSRG